MTLHLSEQQQRIVAAVAANDRDLQVVARAGCGKTTTILAACGVAKGTVAFFAFNKAIATELQAKAPAGVKVQTLHALGFAAIRAAYRRVEVDGDKTYNLTKERIQDSEGEFIAPIKKLVGLVKNNLVEPTDDALYALADEYDVQINGDSERIFALVRLVLKASLPAKGGPVVIDFDDMIWLPAHQHLGSFLPRFDWTFVDEAQDLNAAQMELMRMVAARGRICYVGDPAQAIYSFRGADSNAMDTLRVSLEGMGRAVETLPLTQTRRCHREGGLEAHGERLLGPAPVDHAGRRLRRQREGAVMDPVCVFGGEHGPWLEAGTMVPSSDVFWFCGRCGDVADDDPQGQQAHPLVILESPTPPSVSPSRGGVQRKSGDDGNLEADR